MKRKYYYLLRIKSVGCCNAAVRFAVSFPALKHLPYITVKNSV